jgi:metallo-beta-lactamase family protein
MATLTFLGAARTVTGSRHLLTTAAGKRVLVDAGLFQGLRELRERNWAPWTAGHLDAVVLTHAHIDHTGYLPRLVARNLVSRIVCTAGTRDLAALLLPDSAHLQEEDARLANERGYSRHRPALPLYTAEEAALTVRRLEAFPFDLSVPVVDGVSLTFRRAGHIVGSSFLDVHVDGRRVLFSGDLGRYGTPLLADPDAPRAADALVLECTYGDRLHPREPADAQLVREVQDAITRGGPLLIPAFAVGRTQELLFL